MVNNITTTITRAGVDDRYIVALYIPRTLYHVKGIRMGEPDPDTRPQAGGTWKQIGKICPSYGAAMRFREAIFAKIGDLPDGWKLTAWRLSEWRKLSCGYKHRLDRPERKLERGKDNNATEVVGTAIGQALIDAGL